MAHLPQTKSIVLSQSEMSEIFETIREVLAKKYPELTNEEVEWRVSTDYNGRISALRVEYF